MLFLTPLLSARPQGPKLTYEITKFMESPLNASSDIVDNNIWTHLAPQASEMQLHQFGPISLSFPLGQKDDKSGYTFKVVIFESGHFPI